MRLVGFVFALLALVTPLTAAYAGQPKSDAVFRLIAERLSVMKPVAAWKQARGVAIENLAREKIVLTKATESASAAGISAPSTIAFFEAQISAAKAIQACWMKRWASGKTARPGKAPDLKTDIRPKLIKLGAALVESISNALEGGTIFTGPSRARFDELVQVDCLPAENRDAIYDALGKLKQS